MKVEGFGYIVLTKIAFTEAEFAFLLEASRRHYDYVCRSASVTGSGSRFGDEGFLSFAENRAKNGEPVSEFTLRQLQTLCKLCEFGGIPIPAGLAEDLRTAAKGNDVRSCQVNGLLIKWETPPLST